MEKQTQGILPLTEGKTKQFLKMFKWLVAACVLIFLGLTFLSLSTRAKDMSREEKIDVEVLKTREEIRQIDDSLIGRKNDYNEAKKQRDDAQKIVQEKEELMQTATTAAEGLRISKREKEDRIEFLLQERAGLITTTLPSESGQFDPIMSTEEEEKYMNEHAESVGLTPTNQ